MRALKLVWDGSQEFRGLGDPTGRYDPPLDLVKTSYPEPGKFFRPKDTNSINVATIALRTYGEENTANGVVAIANSTWNRSHIYYAKTGYAPYAPHLIDETGPQQERKYGTAPLSVHGSGTHWPTYWLPPLDGKPEPEEYFGWTPPTEPGQGPTGNTGPTGPQGSQGPAGNDGPPGPIGAPGQDGPAGAMGPMGPMGPQGDIGPQGPPGAGSGDAVPGADGPPGPQGAPGQDGPAGAMGPMGPMGPQGPAGSGSGESIPGPTGEMGPMGPMGPQGAIGPTGSPGNASQDAIAAAVQEYLENNPAITDEQLATAIANYMSAHPIQGSGGGGGSQLPTLAAFSIMGLAMKMGIY